MAFYVICFVRHYIWLIFFIWNFADNHQKIFILDFALHDKGISMNKVKTNHQLKFCGGEKKSERERDLSDADVSCHSTINSAKSQELSFIC